MNEPLWLTAFRDITNATNERTMVSSALGSSGVGNNAPLYDISPKVAAAAAMILANFDSTVLDWAARYSVGGTHLNYYIVRQLPVLLPETFLEEAHSRQTYAEFLAPKVLELTYTAWDLEPFAHDLGYNGPPFIWDEERRFLIRCELDAAFFHLYLGNEEEWKRTGSKELSAYFSTPRDAVAYIMETFPIVKRKDEQTHGTYRTRDTILEIYNEMAEVMRQNAAAVAAGRYPTALYQTRLDPPPGPPVDAEGTFIPMAQWGTLDPHLISHIHPPKEEVSKRPEEVPLEEFVAMVYPSTDADKAICAAALAVVEQSGGLSSMDHLDALLFATHPDWLKVFLNQADQRALEAAMRSAPPALFISQNQSIDWKDCRDYLERLQTITVAHGRHGQPIGAGAALDTAKASLPNGADGVVSYALKALERIRELRTDLASVSQVQRSILNAFESQHRFYQLAA